MAARLAPRAGGSRRGSLLACGLPAAAAVGVFGGCRCWSAPGAAGSAGAGAQQLQVAAPRALAAPHAAGLASSSAPDSGRRHYAALPLAAVAFATCAAASLRARGGVARRAAAAAAVPAEEAPKGGIFTIFSVIWAVLSALPDIFKAPPQEATGKDAPGLARLGPGGVQSALRGCEIVSVNGGAKKDASELAAGPAPWDVFGARSTVLLFITHFGDFNSWEVLQQLRTARREGRLGGARVAVVGIGTAESGRRLAEFLELPEDLELYADPRGACHQALGFSRGALPEYAEQLNPYLRVFLMLLGVGSPGTIRTVLGGYFGNRELKPEQTSWVDEALKQGAAQGRFPTSVPTRLPWEAKKPGMEEYVDLASAGSTVWDGRGFGETGLRPFELATVRLQNMVSGIIEHWGELKPPDDELLVQQGGAVVLNSGEASYFYRDKGILTYVPLEDALAAARSEA